MAARTLTDRTALVQADCDTLTSNSDMAAKRSVFQWSAPSWFPYPPEPPYTRLSLDRSLCGLLDSCTISARRIRLAGTPSGPANGGDRGGTTCGLVFRDLHWFSPC
jgi:hypothetical protein